MPFSLSVPSDFVLRRDACSYGYFLLAPNLWDVGSCTLSRVLSLSGGPALVTVSQPAPPAGGLRGAPLRVATSRRLSADDRREATAQLVRMLRLDEDHAVVRAFHRVDPRWKRQGLCRLFRSPTFFEDVVKTVTSCNVAWPNTMTMNLRLCQALGEPNGRGDGAPRAFPTPQRIARQRPMNLRVRCRVGYRDARIVQLARLFVSGAIDPAWFENPATPDDDVRRALIDLPGIGPYAANNIMQLLGRYGHLPLDSESVRHARSVLGYTGSPRALMKKLQRHYEPFGPHKFRSYWFELWAYYQAKRGKAWTWDHATTGRTFTAALLTDD